MRVRAPWVTEVYRADTDFYIIPNREYVVLGGTAQVRMRVSLKAS